MKNPEETCDENESEKSEVGETEENENSQGQKSLWRKMGKVVFCLIVVYGLSLVFRVTQLSTFFV